MEKKSLRHGSASTYLQNFMTLSPKYKFVGHKLRGLKGIYSVFLVALGESFVSVGVVAVFPYDDALLIFVIPIIFDNSRKRCL